LSALSYSFQFSVLYFFFSFVMGDGFFFILTAYHFGYLCNKAAGIQMKAPVVIASVNPE
jgi:hypothetical protein